MTCAAVWADPKVTNLVLSGFVMISPVKEKNPYNIMNVWNGTMEVNIWLQAYVTLFSDTGHTITFVLPIEKHSKFGDGLGFWFLLSDILLQESALSLWRLTLRSHDISFLQGETSRTPWSICVPTCSVRPDVLLFHAVFITALK